MFCQKCNTEKKEIEFYKTQKSARSYFDFGFSNLPREHFSRISMYVLSVIIEYGIPLFGIWLAYKIGVFFNT